MASVEVSERDEMALAKAGEAMWLQALSHLLSGDGVTSGGVETDRGTIAPEDVEFESCCPGFPGGLFDGREEISANAGPATVGNDL